MSYKKPVRPKNSPFRRDTDERKFSFSFLTLMQEYYQKNNLADPDIFDVDWADLTSVAKVAEDKNAAINFAMAKLEEGMEPEDEDEKLLTEGILGWLRDGLVTRIHYYSADPLVARIELLEDYIREARNTAVKGEIFKLKKLEALLKGLKTK